MTFIYFIPYYKTYGNYLYYLTLFIFPKLMANIYQAHGELWICVTNIKSHGKLWLFILNPRHLYISYHIINPWNLYKNPLSLFILYHNIHNIYFQNSWLVGRYSHEKLTPTDLTNLTSKAHYSSPSPLSQM